jgi:hypothetical protein
MAVQSERRSPRATEGQTRRLIWAYGLASGAMITSTTLFLVPNAISHHAALGGLGIAIGIVGGFSIHTLHAGPGHVGGAARPVAWEFTLHSLGAGLVIGAVYAAAPALGPTLGFAIVSHKAPAQGPRRIRGRPSALAERTVGLDAAASGGGRWPRCASRGPCQPAGSAWSPCPRVWGATGIFLHVAIDFLPRCEWRHGLRPVVATAADSEGQGETEGAHGHRLHWQAIASTVLGGTVVVAAWGLLVGHVLHFHVARARHAVSPVDLV